MKHNITQQSLAIVILTLLIQSCSAYKVNRGPASKKNICRKTIHNYLDSYDNKQAWIGIDLGGTKIAIGAVKDGRVSSKDKLIFRHEIETFPNGAGPITSIKHRNEFLKNMAVQINNVIEKTKALGYTVNDQVGFGSPGLLKDGVITPKTVEQLGEAFYGFNIEKGLQKYLQKYNPSYKVKVKNDALAQLAFGIHTLVKDDHYKDLILDKKVAFLGPGTSLGGGFAKVEKNINGKLDISYFTDGHIFDIPIDGHLAHDQLSGRFFQRTAGKSGKEIVKNIEIYKNLIEQAGENMGKIIEKIYKANFRKPLESTQWSREDLNNIKGITTYILGGSIGTKGEMGKMIQESAKKYLKKQGLSHITIIPLTAESANSAIIGAASFAGLKNL